MLTYWIVSLYYTFWKNVMIICVFLLLFETLFFFVLFYGQHINSLFMCARFIYQINKIKWMQSYWDFCSFTHVNLHKITLVRLNLKCVHVFLWIDVCSCIWIIVCFHLNFTMYKMCGGIVPFILKMQINYIYSLLVVVLYKLSGFRVTSVFSHGPSDKRYLNTK